MSALGKLVASVVLDTAEFTQGTDKAQYAAAKLAGNVDRALGDMERKAKATMAGVGAAMAAGFSVAAISQWIDETAKANATLDDMSEKTGTTVEKLSGMVNVARVGGHDVGLLEASMTKLAKGMAGADDETKGAGRALAYLGIQATDANGKLKDAGALTADIAAKLSTYADGAGKAAIAQELFGKSGAQLLPYLKDLATEGDNVVKVTAKQAAEAENYEKNIKRLAIAKGDLVRTIAQEVIPVLNTMAEMYLKSKTASDGTLASAQKLAADGSIRDWAEKGAYGIAFMVDSANALMTVLGVLGQQIAGRAMQMAELAGAIANPGANAASAYAKITALEKDIADQTERRLMAHRSIRFELEAQLAKQREVDQLVAKYADDKYKDARDLRNRPSLEFRSSGKPATGAASGKSTKDELADIDKLLDSLRSKSQGFDGDFLAKVNKLTQAWSLGRISVYEYNEAMGQLVAMQPAVKNAIAIDTKAREEATAALRKFMEQQYALNESVRGQIGDLQTQIDTFGMSRAATLEYAAAQLEAEAATLTLDEATQDQIDLLKERARLLRDQAGKTTELQNLRDQANVWGELSDRAGAFFGDLVTNGASAFDRLKQSLKSFAQQLIALFAQKWILNMVGQGNLADAVGKGTIQGAITGGGGLLGTAGMFAAVAAGGYGIGSAGANALGAGEKGQKTGGIAGALFGGLAGAIIGKFTDPDGLATRTADFGGGRSNYWHGGGSSAFGGFGVTNDKWFSDADMKAKLQEFEKALGSTEDALAKFLKPDELARATANLSGSKNYSFGTEHGDFSGALGQILKDRIDGIIAAIDPSLQKWLDGFSGTGDELAAYALQLLDVRARLADSSVTGLLERIPDLTIDGLMKMQAAGESLSDTFTRVVNEFMTAEKNLNQAIGARNPQFARDLVLTERNRIGAQFASSIGQTYGADLATQMALNPQSFAGLGTEQMNQLAGWLTLQSELERLDQQLASSGNNVSTSFNNASGAVNDFAARLAGEKMNLAGYLNGLNQSSLSPLTPGQKYIAARQVFDQQASLAEGGNLDAMAGLSGYHQAFLSASQAVNASSGAYNADYFSSYNRLNAITGMQAQNPLTAGVYSAGVQQMGVQIVALQGAVQQITATLQAIYNGPIPVEVVNGEDVTAPLASALDPRAAGAPMG